MKLNIQCSSLIYRAKRVMITSKISDEILIASYDACHPKWSRKQIRCAIRTEHGRKVTFLGISSSCRSRGDPNLSWQRKKGLGNSIKSSVQGWSRKNSNKISDQCVYSEDREKGPGKAIEGKYPPRSHDCMPPETEFANSFEDAQVDVERREKNANKRRTMQMWRNAVEHTWETRPMSEIHKLIDRQPKIMHSIIECEGGRTCYNWEIWVSLQITP